MRGKILTILQKGGIEDSFARLQRAGQVMKVGQGF